MASDDEPPISFEERQIPLVWTGSEELNVLWANQFLIQVAEEEIFLSAGLAVPPPLIGSNEEKLKQLEALDFVPVQTLVRLGLPPSKLRELSALLQGAIEAMDQKPK